MAKILVHSLTFKPDGVSTAYLYADLVLELKKMGHEIEVLTTTPHYNRVPSELERQPVSRKNILLHESTFEGVRVYHIPLKKSKYIFVRLLDFIRFHISAVLASVYIKKFDIVLAPSPPLTIGVVAWILAKLKGGKVIYNVQEIYPDFAINQGMLKNKGVIRLLKGMEKFVYRKSAAVVTIDEIFHRIIHKRIPETHKFHIIPNFVDTELYTIGDRINDFSSRHGLNEEFVISYAGNIGYAQNWEPIVYAASRLKDLPIRFVIIGDGVMKPWLEETIKSQQLDRILLLGYQPREMMPQINAAADIHTIVMNRGTDAEGFPSKIYTIFACGKPVIVSTAPTSPLGNFLREAGCNRRIELDDNEAYYQSILMAYENRAQLPEEGLKGRAFVEQHYSKKAIAAKYDSLIRQVMAEN